MHTNHPTLRALLNSCDLSEFSIWTEHNGVFLDRAFNEDNTHEAWLDSPLKDLDGNWVPLYSVRLIGTSRELSTTEATAQLIVDGDAVNGWTIKAQAHGLEGASGPKFLNVEFD